MSNETNYSNLTDPTGPTDTANPPSNVEPANAPETPANDGDGFVRMSSEQQGKGKPWSLPRTLSKSTKIGQQWLACLSTEGYGTAKHAKLYPYDGKPGKVANKVVATACGIANAIGGKVETKGEGSKLRARVVGYAAGKVPPRA